MIPYPIADWYLVSHVISISIYLHINTRRMHDEHKPLISLPLLFPWPQGVNGAPDPRKTCKTFDTEKSLPNVLVRSLISERNLIEQDRTFLRTFGSWFFCHNEKRRSWGSSAKNQGKMRAIYPLSSFPCWPQTDMNCVYVHIIVTNSEKIRYQFLRKCSRCPRPASPALLFL